MFVGCYRPDRIYRIEPDTAFKQGVWVVIGVGLFAGAFANYLIVAPRLRVRLDQSRVNRVVAHLVCAIPTVPFGSPPFSRSFSSSAILPTDFRVSRCPLTWMVMPAES